MLPAVIIGDVNLPALFEQSSRFRNGNGRSESHRGDRLTIFRGVNGESWHLTLKRKADGLYAVGFPARLPDGGLTSGSAALLSKDVPI